MPENSWPEIEMIFVEGGTFTMGDDNGLFDREKPAHLVQLNSFYIGKYPVTQALWKAVMGAENNPSRFRGDNRPVEMVSWEEAQDFIQKLNTKTNRDYRLPTEAEWEYAARGGKKSDGYKYAGGNKLEDLGWYRENSFGATKPVGLKEPNELGLFDMSGNVREWCWDWYGWEYYQQCAVQGIVSNPQGPDSGAIRVLRGGSWFNIAEYCSVAYRSDYGGPGARDDFLGFRLLSSFQSVG